MRPVFAHVLGVGETMPSLARRPSMTPRPCAPADPAVDLSKLLRG
jgi:hypothetical protein